MPTARYAPEAARRRRLDVSVTLPSVPAKRGRPWIVVIAVTLLLAVAVAILLWHSVRANDGHFILSLDDPYIHLAMARNLSSFGVWGINSAQFSATSSSPLYTIVLALAFGVSGPSEFWVWLFAIAGGLAAAALLAQRIGHCFEHAGVAIAVGLWAVVLAGLPEAMFTGMEHTLHATVILLIVAVATKSSEGPKHWIRSDVLLCALVMVGAGLRYETLFLIPALCGYLLWRGRRLTALVAGIAAVLPALVLGVVQVANGRTVLPNTLLLKGVIGYQHPMGFFSRFMYQIDSPFVALLMVIVTVGAFLSLTRRSNVSRTPQLLLAGLFLSSCLFHATFALTERRYVSYLVALGIWAAVPWIREWTDKARGLLTDRSPSRNSLRLVFGWAMLILVGVFPFADRLTDLPRLWYLGQDIYAQQYQVARFFSSNYRREPVVLNDIGTTAWFGENTVVDVMGLADFEVARKRLTRHWSSQTIQQHVARTGGDVAAVYPTWFSSYGGLPQNWLPVGTWQLPGRIQVNAAAPQVFFYATSPEAAQRLSTRLKGFASQLPKNAIFTSFL